MDIEGTIKARDKARASISKAEKMLDATEESMMEALQTFRRCINVSGILDL